MYRGQFRAPEARIRVLRGAETLWFLGANGAVARLREDHVTSDGELSTTAKEFLQKKGLLDPPVRRSYSLTVATTSVCNLGCSYCYQNLGQDESGGSSPPRIAYARLSSQAITHIIGFTKARMAEAGLEQLTLMLYGGEPLLNPKGCLELLTRAADLNLASASMVSNGTHLTPEMAKQLADLGLRSAQITFDGDRDDHDRIRLQRKSGAGTFDLIVNHLVRAAEVTDIAFGLRVNVSHENYVGVERLIDRLAGALDTSRFSIYFTLVGDVGIGFHNQLQLGAELTSRVASWNRRALDAGFDVPRPRAHLPCTACSFKDGKYGAVVAADGTLSSCTETTGLPEWQVGTVRTGYLPSEVTNDRWVSCAQRYREYDDLAAWNEFRDQVDAALLDDLTAAGRL